LGVLLLGQITFSAPALQPTHEVIISADNAVTPIDYSFMENAAAGQLEIYDLKNLYGAGAKLHIYINTATGKDRLVFAFGGGFIEARLAASQLAVVTGRVSEVSKTNPIIVRVENDGLTVKIGSKSNNVKGVNEFTGMLTTQSIEGKVKVYQFIGQ
jgi:hypothetical protein